MRNTIQSLAAACILALVAGCIHGEAAPAPAAPQAATPASPQWLFPVYVNGKVGFIDETGRMRIEPQFDYTLGFSRRAILFVEGADGPSGYETVPEWGPSEDDAPLGTCLAPVKVGAKWGYIDPGGRMTISPQFDWAQWFYGGLAAVNLGGNSFAYHPWGGGKWGYINARGQWVVKPQFDQAKDFREGLARVSIGGKYGFIDERGQWAVQPVLEQAGKWFSNGLTPATLTKDGRWGYIDKTGRFALPPKFLGAWEFSEGFAFVTYEGSRGYIDVHGVMVARVAREYHLCFSEGLAALCEKVQGGFWGDPVFPIGPWKYIDKTGKVVIPPEFAGADYFSEGLAAVQNAVFYRRFGFFDEWHWDGVEDHGEAMTRNGKWGFIDKTGKYVIPPTFDRVLGGFYHGIARVVKDGRECYINKSGTVIWRGAAVDPSPY
jgi:hypothetical protein